MKILIIGGTRFVGPYMVERLIKEGHELTIFNRGNIKSEYENVSFIKGDRNAGLKVDGHFDVVIDTCARNGANTKQAMDNLDFDFFVHMSTIAVYKKTETFPITEDSPIGEWPVWGDRGKSKIECEIALKESGIKYASIRPVYILGPKNYADRENFIYSRIKSGVPLVLPGNGEAIAQFVFARDVADSLVLLATKKQEGIFNCSGNEVITLKGLVEEMGNIVGKKPIIEYNPERDGPKHLESEFPFPNENVYSTNQKLKDIGVKFTPLVEWLKNDYDTYYSKNLK